LIPSKAQYYIDRFGLIEHPEGGWYKETYRSQDTTKGGSRSLLTSIYFLITTGNISRLHRIKSDELWYFHDGAPLTIHSISKDGTHLEQKLGLNIDGGEVPFHLVPKDSIFGSCLDEENAFAFVSCSVAPGFDFADFELFSYRELAPKYPHLDLMLRKMS
jgi:predicted cupin superfamily sugar epimerase